MHSGNKNKGAKVSYLVDCVLVHYVLYATVHKNVMIIYMMSVYVHNVYVAQNHGPDL